MNIGKSLTYIIALALALMLRSKIIVNFVTAELEFNRYNELVKTVNTKCICKNCKLSVFSTFCKKFKLHKFATTNSNFE